MLTFSFVKARLEELESVYAALKPTELVVQEPRAGQWCVARFNDDGLFYRSRVVDVRDGQASLVFVDYGNTQVPTPGRILSDISAFSCCLRSRFTSNGNR